MFSVNPHSGKIESYTENGEYVGHVFTMGDFISSEKKAEDGGPGSGNHGHAGRPGKVGGSAPEKGGVGSPTEKNKELSGMSVRIANSIAKKAEKHPKVYDDWASELTADEGRAIEDQFFETHKKDANGYYSESISDYYERIWRMLAANAPEIKHVNKPVDGKDIAKDYGWNEVSYTEPEFGQVIDTQIEDILVKQGFNGVPKIVSKEEMDKILEEHPEAPIMFRTYSAPDKATLDQYDKDLEEGAWYVDCSIGGSKYGQGMYTAAALPWKVEDLNSVYSGKLFNDSTRGVVVADKKTGEIYQLDTDTAAYIGTIDRIEDGETAVFRHDESDYTIVVTRKGDQFVERDTGKAWDEDALAGFDWMAKANVLPKEELSKRDISRPMGQMQSYIKHNKGFAMRQDTRTEEYYAEKSRLDDLAVPMYGHYNDGSKWTESNGPEIITAVGENDDVYYEVSPDGKKIDREGMDNLPPGNYLITYDDADFKTGSQRSMYMLRVDKDGSKHCESAWETESVEDRFDDISKKNPEVHECKDITPKKPDPIVPVSSTRRMTLDPSAKTITYEKLEELHKSQQESASKKDIRIAKEVAEEAGLNEEQADSFRNLVIMNANLPFQKRASDLRWKTHVEKVGGEKKANELLEKFSEKYARTRQIKDIGAYAAALGYDAVVCSNYGRTIVVLNRTKLILSNERVEVPKEEAS